jgi:hypothetical protein
VLLELRTLKTWGGKQYFDPTWADAALASTNQGEDFIKDFLLSEVRLASQLGVRPVGGHAALVGYLKETFKATLAAWELKLLPQNYALKDFFTAAPQLDVDALKKERQPLSNDSRYAYELGLRRCLHNRVANAPEFRHAA